MAVATHLVRTTQQQTETFQQQIPTMYRLFSWLQQILSFVFPSIRQLPPTESTEQTDDHRQSSTASLFENVGPVHIVDEVERVKLDTHITYRSNDNNALLSTMPEGVSRYYRNKGAVLEAKSVTSIDSTTTIGIAPGGS